MTISTTIFKPPIGTDEFDIDVAAKRGYNIKNNNQFEVGLSGSPVLDKDDNLIGIFSRQCQAKGGYNERCGFVWSTESIKTVIDRGSPLDISRFTY